MNQWKKLILDNAEELFGKGSKTRDEGHEQEKERLYSQIGKLQVEADWLKKNASSWEPSDSTSKKSASDGW